jgi:hypothetical protein
MGVGPGTSSFPAQHFSDATATTRFAMLQAIAEQ